MKKNLFIFLLGVCIFLIHKKTYSQKINAHVDTSSILIGDAIHLTLTATYDPTQFKIQFPSIEDTFNHFEVIERNKIDTVFGRENNIYTQKIRITNFDSGVWVIPPFSFNIKPLQGKESFSLNTDSFQINVNTISIDTSKPFQPIFGIRSASMPLQHIIMYIAGGIIALGILIFVIYYLVKKYRNKNKQASNQIPAIVLPPHEKAYAALDALENQALWQNGQEKEYHTLLTDIMRTYLEEQFSLDCFEKTSSEIIAQVKRTKALSNCRQYLRQLFETADMVKFAKSKPTPEQHIDSLKIARLVITESYKKIKPIEEPLTK
ncbi:MAG: hypothetical protein IPF62_07490 [Bacteroidetes bacterium]|nr:hypothetical protein [Bacteroidota bacterium]